MGHRDMSVRLVRAALSRTRHDLATPEGRGADRVRRAALTGLAAAAAKGVSVLTIIVTIPLSLQYLGAERYGLWMAVTTVLSVVAFADLGIGHGLTNAVAKALGRSDTSALQQAIASAFFPLLALGASAIVGILLLAPHVPWATVYNLSTPEAAADARAATVAAVCVFAINMPLGVVVRIQLGHQEGFRNQIWTAAGSALSLVGVGVSIRAGASLGWLVAAYAGGPALAVAANGVALFFGRRHLIPRWSMFRLGAAKDIIRAGLLFVLIQLGVALSMSSDNMVLTHALGPADVASFAIIARAFSFAVLPIGMALGPLWPAYGEAHARGDHEWVRRTLLKSARLSASTALVLATALALAAPTLIPYWAGAEVVVPFELCAALAIWSVLFAVGSALAVFLNGIGVLRFQAVAFLAVGVISLPLKYVLASYAGPAGTVWGLILPYGAMLVLLSTTVLPRVLRSLDSGRP
jgi:O-antigen/teichoic acid export membrane protein